jgi:hypothetical protein
MVVQLDDLMAVQMCLLKTAEDISRNAEVAMMGVPETAAENCQIMPAPSGGMEAASQHMSLNERILFARLPAVEEISHFAARVTGSRDLSTTLQLQLDS